MNISKVTTESALKLKSKMMGGVSRESAVEAIESAAKKVADVMQEEATAAQRNFQTSIEQLRRSHTEEIAAKDSFISGQSKRLSETQTALTSTQQENQTLGQKLAGVVGRIKRTATFRKIKTNPDGTEVFVKANVNGAKMEKVLNKDGKVVQINVEQLDGRVRRTTYNPETGKPIRTYTNTGKDPVEILYDQYGRPVRTRKLNVKKDAAQKAPKPTVVSTKILRNDDVKELESKMSDGSIKKVMILKSNGDVIQSSHASSPDCWNSTGVWYNKDSNGVRRFVKRSKNEAGKIVEKFETIYPSGIKIVSPYSKVTDDFGITRRTERMLFPKSSKVKHIDRTFVEDSNGPAKEIIKMKDGTIYELTDFVQDNPRSVRGDRLFVPTKGIKIAQNGTRIPVEQETILDWLKTFHPTYNKDLYNA